MRPHRPLSALATVLLAGCQVAPVATTGRAVAALTVGPELTLLPDLPGASAPVEALGHAATAAAGEARATAWSTAAGGGSVAFWSAADGLRALVELGAGVASRPLVLSDGRIFVVAWRSASGVVASRFDAAGARLDAAPLLVSPEGDPTRSGDALAGVYDGRDFALAYGRGAGSVEVARVSVEGAVRDRRAVALLGASAVQRVRLARSTTGYLVAATGHYSATFAYRQLAYVRLGADLAPLDAAPRLLGATPRERGLEDVASDGADYLILWSDEATPTAGAARLLAARVPAATGAAAPAVDVGPGTSFEDSAGAWAERVPGAWLVARFDAASFTTRLVHDAGDPAGTTPTARAVGAGLAGKVSRLRDGAGLVLTWATGTGTGTRALATSAMADDGAVRSPVSQPLTIPGGASASAFGLDWDGHSFVAAWSEGTCWASRVDRAGTRLDARGVSIAPGFTTTLSSSAGQHAYARDATPPFSVIRRYVVHRRDGALAPVGAEATLVEAERIPVFGAAGGPIGYLFSTHIAYVPGLSVALRFMRADGTFTGAASLFNFRSDYPEVAYAASRTQWTVAWTSRVDGITPTCSIVVDQFTPAGEFATVPFEIPLPCAQRARVSVASDGTDFLVSWSAGAELPVFGVRVRADGTAADATPIRVAPAGGLTLRSAWDGRAYTLAWTSATSAISAARVDASGRALDAAPATLAPGGRSGADFALAADGAGTLALAYGRTSTGGVVRAQVRLFDWEAVASDGGVDAGRTDVGVGPAPDAPAADVPDAPAVGADVAADAGERDAGADAGPRDAGTSMTSDGAVPTPDVVTADVGSVGAADAAVPPGDEGGGGCSIAGAPTRGPSSPRSTGPLAALAALVAVTRRRRPLPRA